ncbi:MAG: branched-chain amino acid ABC transporter permease [Chloroflexota bacterium]
MKNIRKIIAIGMVIGITALSLNDLNLAVSGLLLGILIGMVSLGLSLVFKLFGYANIAHGDFITVGAYAGYFVLGFSWFQVEQLWRFSFGFGVLPAILVAAIIGAGIGVAGEKFIYKRLRSKGASATTMGITSLGYAILLRGVVQSIWGSELRYYPNIASPYLIGPFDIIIPPNHIFIMLTAGFMLGSTYWVINKTFIGLNLKATADNADLSLLSGVNVQTTRYLAWSIAGALAGASGVLFVLFNATSQLKPVMGFSFLVPIFAAVILGGLGSLTGALLGGLAVGLIMQTSTAFIDPTYKVAIAFCALIVVLLFKPAGILGKR